MYDFIPEERLQFNTVEVPFIEDARADKASGYRSGRTAEKLQGEIGNLITQLGGAGIRFEMGAFGGKPKRYGYIVHFFIPSTDGRLLACRIPIAGLPMRSETPIKKQQVLVQVLYAFREYLQGELNALRYRPGHAPFAPYMVLPSGRTLIEEMAVRAQLPQGDQQLGGLLEGGR